MLNKKIYSQISYYIIKWTLLSTLLGALGANLVLITHKGIDFLSQLAAANQLVSPLFGGSLVGIIIYYIDYRAAGLGTNLYINQTKGNGVISAPVKLLVSKLIATQITLGLIGVGGLVGPLLLLGSSLASCLKGVLELFQLNIADNRLQIKVLSVCGAAATLGPLLGAPLGGGIFASEVLYKSSLDYNDLFPAILSSSLGHFFYQSSLPVNQSQLAFQFPEFTTLDILLLIVAALICGLLGQSFILIFNWMQRKFAQLSIPVLFKPLVASGLVVVIYMLLDIELQIDSTGLEQIFFQLLSLKTVSVFLLAKICLAIIVISSGGSAAVVDVALLSGAAAGNLLSYLFPTLSLSVLVIVGLSATLASIANVPLATIVLVTEMFNLNSSLPVVIGAVIGFLVGRPKIVFKYIER
ncbi:chloride channel protein [Halanaerobaculum tunisiense]